MPTPLHPLVVHLPIALAVLLPFVTVAGFLLARRPGAGRGPWLAVVSFALLLPAAAWAALATGEAQEDAVEAVVAEAPLHTHEEAAEVFLGAAVLLGALALGGLLPGRSGTAARVIAVPVAVLVLGLGFRVGSSGGALVYTHGAASAYAGGVVGAGERAAVLRERDDDDHEGDRGSR